MFRKYAIATLACIGGFLISPVGAQESGTLPAVSQKPLLLAGNTVPVPFEQGKKHYQGREGTQGGQGTPPSTKQVGPNKGCTPKPMCDDMGKDLRTGSKPAGR